MPEVVVDRDGDTDMAPEEFKSGAPTENQEAHQEASSPVGVQDTNDVVGPQPMEHLELEDEDADTL